MNTTLKKIFLGHKGKISDKWSLYINEWDRLFASYRSLQIQLLEIGIQNGGSLEIFGKYFSKASKIVGCDIDKKCGDLLYKNPAIAIVVGDANSDECEGRILEQAPWFDIIIDDGSHISSDIVRSFARYFPHLRDGGVYIIEDLHASYWTNFGGGLHNPLSIMSFLKRLSDVINYEHWRNNRSKENHLSEFEVEFGIRFEDSDLERIHSIEFINSLCIIKKLSPEDNVLGKRYIAGSIENVTTGWKKLGGVTLQETEMPIDIKDDAPLDVFELISKTNILSRTINDRDLALQAITAQLLEKENTVQALSVQLAEKEQSVQVLSTQVAEKDQEIISYVMSKSWRITRPLRKFMRIFKEGKNIKHV